ncbi:MAG: YebC/PmpR family DNA-binding transcriptional regulator, partial [Acidaminococcaceae bacterium]
KGIFSVAKEGSPSEEELMLLVLEAGAEDMKTEEEGYEIITAVEDYNAVEKVLADNNIEIAMSEIAMIPDTMVALYGEDAVKVQRMIDGFEELDDVQDVYTNADLPDEE